MLLMANWAMESLRMDCSISDMFPFRCAGAVHGRQKSKAVQRVFFMMFVLNCCLFIFESLRDIR